MVNEHEARSRAVKAAKIARVMEHAIEHAGLSVDDVERAEDDAWQHAAAIAGVRPPSAETREIVIRILRERGR